MDAKHLLKASALLSAVVNCSSLRVKVSGREEPVVFVLKNLQNSFGFSLTELGREEMYSCFFDRIMFFMLRRSSRYRSQSEDELVDFALFLTVSFLLRTRVISSVM